MSYMQLAITMEAWEEGITLHSPRTDRTGMILTIAQCDLSIVKISKATAPISYSTAGRTNDE